ncbi:MAG: efflux RND transporter periplasmic adaptor subunit [Dehalococcoidia bacterium]
MVNELDDLAPAGVLGAWRKKLIAAGVVAVVAGAGAYALWATTLRSSGASQTATQTQAVVRGTIRQTVTETGTVAAQSSTNLSFQQSGQVKAVNVTLGQQVKAGDVLATQDTTDLQNALATARTTLAAAQIRLHQLEQGPTATQLGQAEQPVAQAQAQLDTANNNLATLTGGPAAADEAAAQQAVSSAQAQLQQALLAQQTLTQGPTQADVSAAQAAVTTAQVGLTAAQNSATNAQNAQAAAQASLYSAETGYCLADASMQFCAARSAPISAADQAALLTATQTPATPTATGQQPRYALAAAVLGSNTGYLSATNAAANASAGVGQAQASLTAAQAKLAQLQAAPSGTSAAQAAAAVTAAQQALAAANAKLSTLNGGPTPAQLQSAQDAVTSATVALQAAQANRNEVAAGSTADTIALQQTSVQLAYLGVLAAQNSLKKAEIVAPYDGTVAALNVNPGDFAGASSANSSTAPIVLNTPNLVVLDLTVSDTDLPQLKVGDRGVATIDAFPGQIFPIEVTAIGNAPTVTQGVITYVAEAAILPGRAGGNGGAGSPPAAAAATPQAGATARAAVTPGGGQRARASRTPGAGGLGSGRRTSTSAQPASGSPMPGMSASAVIQVNQASNVLIVPDTALKRQGRETVAQVQQADGTIKTVAVQTGLSDGTNTEITSGLSEGDKVVIPSLSAAVSGTTTNTTTNPRGGFGPPANGVPGGVR